MGNVMTFGCHEMISDEDFRFDYRDYIQSIYFNNPNKAYTRIRTYEKKRELIKDIFDVFNYITNSAKNKEEFKDAVKWIKNRLSGIMENTFMNKYKVREMLKKKTPTTDVLDTYSTIESVFLFRVDKHIIDLINDMFTTIQVIVNKCDVYYNSINTININNFNSDEYEYKLKFMNIFWRFIEIHMHYAKWILDAYLKFIIMWDKEEILHNEMKAFVNSYKDYDKNLFDAFSKIKLEATEEHSKVSEQIDRYFKYMKDQGEVIASQPDDEGMKSIKMMYDFMKVSCMELHSHLCSTILDITDESELFEDIYSEDEDSDIITNVKINTKMHVLIFFLMLLQNKVASHYMIPSFLDPLQLNTDFMALENEVAENVKLGKMINGEKGQTEVDPRWPEEFGAEDQ